MRSLIFTFMLLVAITPAALAQYQVGDTIDDFTLLDPNGQPVRLSDFAGDVILINFFATWCPPCNEEAPLLQEMYTGYRDQGLAILGIDLLEDPVVVSGWAQSFGLTYPIAMSPDWSLFQLFPGAGGFPYNAVLDRSGVLRYGEYGINMEVITGLVEDLLLEDPVAADPAAFGAVKALYR
jgi:cytochrome c biogenesis protein CcmG/thiol:disulfide interchange protein DsbE